MTFTKGYSEYKNTPSKDIISIESLGYAHLSDNLNNVIWESNQPLILGIFGQRGGGKTFFINEWSKKSKLLSRKVVIFSAWDYDYAADPLFAILGEINKEFKELDINKFLGPLAAVLGFGVDLALAANQIPVKGSKILKSFTAPSQLNIQEILEKSRQEIHAKLSELVKIHGNIVIVIDELDRCRPNFSISVLERLKHFFFVEKIKFIVIGNENQLINSYIHEFGGKQDDAEEYYRRLIDYTISFPEPNLEEYISVRISRLTTLDDNQINSLINAMIKISRIMHLKLRDFEQVLSTYLYATAAAKIDENIHQDYLEVLVSLATIKVQKQQLLNELLSIINLKSYVNEWGSRPDDNTRYIKHLLIEPHKYIMAHGFMSNDRKLGELPWSINIDSQSYDSYYFENIKHMKNIEGSLIRYTKALKMVLTQKV